MNTPSTKDRLPRGSWLQCPEVQRDHSKVIRAVKQVGRSLPRFTTRDVSKHLERPQIGVLSRGELSRHLDALDGEVIIRVDGTEPGPVPKRAHREWALRENLHILESKKLALRPNSDAERAVLAVNVAAQALDSSDVPTREVTRVLQTIVDLGLEHDQQTSTVLHTLSGRKDPPVRKIRIEGERWVRWRPVGTVEHPRFGEWVRTYRGCLREAGSSAEVGHAAYSEVARELVLIAINTSTHHWYPHGKPPPMRELEERAKKDTRGKELVHALARRKIELVELLGDATKATAAGRARVNQRVVRIHGPLSGRVYYDVPGSHGFQGRTELPRFWDLQEAAKPYELEAILEEAQAAQDLRRVYPERTPGLAAIVVVRRLLAALELDRLHEQLVALERDAGLLSHPVREKILELQGRVRGAQRQLGALRPLETQARVELKALGLGLDEVAAGERPRVFPEDWDRWFTDRSAQDLTAAQHLARTVSLRRFRNPDFEARGAEDEAGRCTTFVDRVQALPLAATIVRAAADRELSAGQRLLGRNLRHPGLLVRALEGPLPSLRRDALWALALLKAPEAATWIQRRFDDPRAPAEEVVAALHTAAVMDLLDPEKLPPWLRNPRHPEVTRAVQSVVRAHQVGGLAR